MNIKIAIFVTDSDFDETCFIGSVSVNYYKVSSFVSIGPVVDRTDAKRLEINFIKINLKSIWKFCFQHNFFMRSNLDVKLFPSRSEYFKLSIWIYRFTKFRSGDIAGFLGHSLFPTFILRSIYATSNPLYKPSYKP